jgi:uncharacterized protein YjbI with pentapeptide repeats
VSDEPPPVRCDDSSTWRHKGEKIDLSRLLQLIEENGGPEGLDLHGADLSELDASPEPLCLHAEAYAREHGPDVRPPWLARDATLPQLDDQDGINLSGAHLESADLYGGHLQNARLMDARLENADLMVAHLQNARLGYAHLGRARLYRAQLQNADLSHADLENADLGGALLESTGLEQAHMENANLWGAHLKDADLQSAHLEDADLGGARLDGALWYGCYLARTRIRRDSLGQAIGDELMAHEEKTPGDYRDASETYLLLKNHFNSIGRYEDASWAYVKEQQMEKMAYYREWVSCGWQIWSACGPLWRWLRNWLYELTTGYGERPWNPVGVAAFSILAFAFGYSLSGGVHGFADALIYSLATFATFNLARPEVQPQGTGMEMASSLEALLGIGILALFVYTLGNRMSRS